MSHRTKTALASALKKAMAHKSLNKITVRELIEDCNINRQTFYYHFTDIYQLMQWSFEQDAAMLLEGRGNVLLWQDGLLQLLRYLDENRAVCLCALRSVGRETIRHMFYDNLYGLIHQTIEDLGRELDIPEPIKADHMDMLTQFCIVSLMGTMECWLNHEIQKSPEELADFADDMIRSLITGEKARYGLSPGSVV
jgi:probable dihydroxyacetone kinase regulator